jgi:hypothetical protein
MDQMLQIFGNCTGLAGSWIRHSDRTELGRGLIYDFAKLRRKLIFNNDYTKLARKFNNDPTELARNLDSVVN